MGCEDRLERALALSAPSGCEKPSVRYTKYCLAIVLLLIFSGDARADTATLSQTLNLTIGAISKVSVPASLSLTATGSIFNAYTRTLTVSFRARSTAAGSGGTITVLATTNFTPANGPNVSSATLTYTCSAATLGTACSGTQTVSLSSSTSVLTIPASACTGGGSPCSSADPNTVNVNLSLPNDPTYKTGTYSASLTFTISST